MLLNSILHGSSCLDDVYKGNPVNYAVLFRRGFLQEDTVCIVNHYVQPFHLHTSRVESLLSSAYVVDLCSIQGRPMDAAAEGFLSFKLIVK